MAEETVVVATSETPDEQAATPDLAAEVEKWKSLSRKNEDRAKANSGAAKRLEEIENASKSETERLNARADAAEKAAAEHQATAMRLEVAFDKGLTPAQVKRLVGSSREDLESDADEIKRDFPAATTRPRGDADQGPRRNATANPRDAFAALFQQ